MADHSEDSDLNIPVTRSMSQRTENENEMKESTPLIGPVTNKKNITNVSYPSDGENREENEVNPLYLTPVNPVNPATGSTTLFDTHRSTLFYDLSNSSVSDIDSSHSTGIDNRTDQSITIAGYGEK